MTTSPRSRRLVPTLDGLAPRVVPSTVAATATVAVSTPMDPVVVDWGSDDGISPMDPVVVSWCDDTSVDGTATAAGMGDTLILQ